MSSGRPEKLRAAPGAGPVSFHASTRAFAPWYMNSIIPADTMITATPAARAVLASLRGSPVVPAITREKVPGGRPALVPDRDRPSSMDAAWRASISKNRGSSKGPGLTRWMISLVSDQRAVSVPAS